MSFVSVGSALVGIVGGVAGAQGAKASASSARKIGAINSVRLRAQADAALEQADRDIVLMRQQLSRVVGDQRAAWGASGLSGDSGSALDVLASSVTAGLQDQQRRRELGEQQASDLRYAALTGDVSTAAMIEQYNAQATGALVSGLSSATQSLSKFTLPKKT